MKIITRFAPSPTGFLHIGGVRTALFNWLYAKNHGGLFKLRIEDTDLKRSTNEAKQAIINGLNWMKLDWDGDIIYQSKRLERHKEVVEILLKKGYAYKCYCSPEDLEKMREKARLEKRAPKYNGNCRNLKPNSIPKNVKSAIRIKCPEEGITTLNDLIQGEIKINNSELDDFIIMRSDKTPTYMLSVVVDDHDMEISHVIRGDDHLTNTIRQQQIYNALNWEKPIYAHIPLIHGMDGGKLSKRHGALGVNNYEEMGYLTEAMLNYLLRLGWSHGDKEIFSREEAINLFNLESIGKASAKFDIERLNSLNATYINNCNNNDLINLINNMYKEESITLEDNQLNIIKNGLNGLKARARTLIELKEMTNFYTASVPIPLDEKSKKVLNSKNIKLLKDYSTHLEDVKVWKQDNIEKNIKDYCFNKNIKLGQLAQPLRAATTGKSVSPGLYELIEVLGKKETLKRILNINN